MKEKTALEGKGTTERTVEKSTEKIAEKGTEKNGDKATGKVNSLFSLDELSKLVKILEQHDVCEFELERGSEKVRLRRGPQQVVVSAPTVSAVMPAPAYAMDAVPALTPPASSASATPRVEVATSPADLAKKNGAGSSASYHEVKSPMVGTFYKRPAPDAKPYAEVGTRVKKGDVLCIVEAMKLMNEIEADVAGLVVEVCLNDAQMCEYGEVLFRINPAA